MSISKYVKGLSIEPVEEINIKKRVEFANQAALFLVDSLPTHDLDYLKILDTLQKTKIVVAKTPSFLSPVNYSYADETIYISDEKDLDLKNEYIWHEMIHRIQESKNRKGKLMQFGICRIFETKIQGLALNEAAIQYLIAKILENPNETVEVYGMKIPTSSKNYYPIVTNLIEQLAFVLGDKLLIESVLNSNEEFKYNTIDELGEDTYFSIQSNFDKILETKAFITESNQEKILLENMEKIKQLYIDTQALIFKSYFDRLLKRVETANELKMYKRKLIQYRELIGSEEGFQMYKEYYEKQTIRINLLEGKINKQSLVIVSENKIAKFFNKIKQIITGIKVSNE